MPGALLRPAGAVLVEQHDEWAAADRRYFAEHTMTMFTTVTDDTIGDLVIAEPGLLTA